MADAAAAEPPVWCHLAAIAEPIPLLVSIPHTGTFIPPAIAAKLSSAEMGSGVMTDWYLHRLYSFLPQMGIEVLHATHHRFVIDLNRPPDSAPLYPGRFETGLVPTETFQGETVWREPPTPTEIQTRLARYYRPYHETLDRLLQDKVRRFGRCYLIDAHSVASRANRLHAALTEDIYLGDRDGQSCDPEFTALVRGAFQRQGLGVSLNQPYKGGYITEHYHSLAPVQTLQIEMCQRLYMPEDAPQRALEEPRFAHFQQRLQAVVGEIAAAVGARQLRC